MNKNWHWLSLGIMLLVSIKYLSDIVNISRGGGGAGIEFFVICLVFLVFAISTLFVMLRNKMNLATNIGFYLSVLAVFLIALGLVIQYLNPHPAPYTLPGFGEGLLAVLSILLAGISYLIGLFIKNDVL